MFAKPDLSRFDAVRRTMQDAHETLALDRRSFVRLVLMSGAGLVIGGEFIASGAAEAAPAGSSGMVMPFVRISPDNVVTVVIKHQDKGQGIATGLSTLVAEELDADWGQVRPSSRPPTLLHIRTLLSACRGRVVPPASRIRSSNIAQQVQPLAP